MGTASRCKVCGLSIRGPLGFVNRAIWGVAPLSKHPDLCKDYTAVGDVVNVAQRLQTEASPGETLVIGQRVRAGQRRLP